MTKRDVVELVGMRDGETNEEWFTRMRALRDSFEASTRNETVEEYQARMTGIDTNELLRLGCITKLKAIGESLFTLVSEAEAKGLATAAPDDFMFGGLRDLLAEAHLLIDQLEQC